MKKVVFAFAIGVLGIVYFICTQGAGGLSDVVALGELTGKGAGSGIKMAEKKRRMSAAKIAVSDTGGMNGTEARAALHAGAASAAEEGAQIQKEEEQVDIFDGLADEWSSASEGRGVRMEDIEKFVSQFRKVPQERKEECLQRALNLIPDENVMLLAGILFDKAQDKDLVVTVFNDILNRDESVKRPIMEQIFKDKSHPCWADVAWIFDVTGGLPGSD